MTGVKLYKQGLLDVNSKQLYPKRKFPIGAPAPAVIAKVLAVCFNDGEPAVTLNPILLRGVTPAPVKVGLVIERAVKPQNLWPKNVSAQALLSVSAKVLYNKGI